MRIITRRNTVKTPHFNTIKPLKENPEVLDFGDC